MEEKKHVVFLFPFLWESKVEAAKITVFIH